MNNLDELRKEIDALDRELVATFVKRQETARAIGEEKKKEGLEIFNPDREKKVLEHVREMAGEKYADDVEALYKEILVLSKKNQE